MTTAVNLTMLRNAYNLPESAVRRLKDFDELFVETAAHTNLVSRSTIPERAQRHYADSLQLLAHIPQPAATLLDIGAGAGFPGLVLAAVCQDTQPNLAFTLSDSVGKKARFLSEAIALMNLENAVATNTRAETLPDQFDVITARAVTSLPKLMDLAVPRLAPGGTMLFPKGRRANEELGEARERWHFEVDRVESVTEPHAAILILRQPERRL